MTEEQMIDLITRQGLLIADLSSRVAELERRSDAELPRGFSRRPLRRMTCTHCDQQLDPASNVWGCKASPDGRHEVEYKR